MSFLNVSTPFIALPLLLLLLLVCAEAKKAIKKFDEHTRRKKMIRKWFQAMSEKEIYETIHDQIF